MKERKIKVEIRKKNYKIYRMVIEKMKANFKKERKR